MSTYKEEHSIKSKLVNVFEEEIKKISNSNDGYSSIMKQKANKKLFCISQSMKIIHNGKVVYSPKCDLTVGPYFFEKGDTFTYTTFFMIL